MKSPRMTLKLAGLVTVAVLLAGCGALDQFTSRFKNSFLGNGGKLTVYDDWGNNTLTLKDVAVSIGLLKNSANGEAGNGGFPSEVLDIQIDGRQMLHVGSTMVFAEQGLAAVEDYDFAYLQRVSGENRASYIPLERSVNTFFNRLGKGRVVVVKTQSGIVVGLYEGDRVSVSIPTDLPKTTLVTIDGKALYIHRADYEVFDAGILKP